MNTLRSRLIRNEPVDPRRVPGPPPPESAPGYYWNSRTHWRAPSSNQLWTNYPIASMASNVLTQILTWMADNRNALYREQVEAIRQPVNWPDSHLGPENIWADTWLLSRPVVESLIHAAILVSADLPVFFANHILSTPGGFIAPPTANYTPSPPARRSEFTQHTRGTLTQGRSAPPRRNAPNRNSDIYIETERTRPASVGKPLRKKMPEDDTHERRIIE